MDVCHSLIFFVLTLQDGNTGLFSAQHSVYSGIEGENVRVQCSFPSSRTRKFFCKEPCKQNRDILIETTDATAQSGRYSIDYKDRRHFVTISQLTKSDSGRYRCGVGSSLSSASYEYIEIIVVDAMLYGDLSAEKTINARTGGNIVVECYFTRSGTQMYFCKEKCEGDILVETTSETYLKDRYSIRYVEGYQRGGFLYVSIEQLTQSDSGWYRCGLGRTNSRDPSHWFRLIVTDALTTSSPSSSVPSASTETSNQSESSTSSPASPKTTEQPESTTTTGVILYVRLTLVVLVIVSSLSVLVFCRKRTCKAKSEEPEPRVETQNASAPDAEDDPSQPTYSEIKFVSVGSSQSGFHGDAECVIYSVPQVEASSDEPPLYSTVNNPQ
ncbi:polymeric immunoglobulin receptor-like [Trematomus bernacchii]|uniref:polymeric immunoglobulin receptor-like n=1 Tax=Trematomus bernacchii TaxID=40690 RepID=UPI00146A1C16|nr:polymeric immunoglobulin receptor-like [Trematomus bernacchii]